MSHGQPSEPRWEALLGGFLLAVAAVAVVLSAAVEYRPWGSPPARSAEAPSPAAKSLARPSSPPSASAVRPTTTPTPEPHTQRREATGIRPIHIRIPAIDVTARIIDLGLNDDGSLEVPEAFDQAGWWTGGTAPGAEGPAVVVGHVDSRAGPGVFYRLRDLAKGDRIELRDRRDRVVRFVVDRIEQHPKDDFPTDAVYGDTEHPTLRLITCGGTFDRSARSYVDNVIVYASRTR